MEKGKNNNKKLNIKKRKYENSIPLIQGQEEFPRIYTESKDNKYKKTKNIIDGNESNDKKETKTAKPKTVDSNFKDFTLTFSKLHKGMIFLGSVYEINDLDLTISLPNNLFGYISISEISPEISKKVSEYLDSAVDENSITDTKALISLQSDLDYKVGSLLRVIVISLDTVNKRIELSTKPNLLNAKLFSIDNIRHYINTNGLNLVGSIKNILDKGYILDLGIRDNNKDIEGFLPFDNCYNSVDNNYHYGQTLLLSVVSINQYSNRAILSEFQNNSKNYLNVIDNTNNVKSIYNLQAGNLVFVTISNIVSNYGLIVTFLEYFKGYISISHLSNDISLDEYKVGQKVKARIISINYDTKWFLLSLKNHLVDEYSAFQFNYDIEKQPKLKTGLIIEGNESTTITIARIDPILGIFLSININEIRYSAYCHISNISDERIENIDKKFIVGEKITKCRIISFNCLDGFINVTLQPSVLSQLIYSYEDITIGMVLDCTIHSFLEKGGILVDINPNQNIRAIIPDIHLSDIKLKKPQKKFKVGSKLTCRVLTLDISRKRLILTNKSSLVSSKLPLLINYEDAKPGIRTHGYVTASRPSQGLFISFYNNVHGMIPSEEVLLHTGLSNSPENFHKGQMLEVTVAQCNLEKRHLLLSLANISNSDDFNTSAIRPGTFMNGKITGISNNSLILTVHFGDKHWNDILIPFSHTTDHPSLALPLFQQYSIGQEISSDQLMVLSTDNGKPNVVTMKPLLISALNNNNVLLPNSLETLVEGMMLIGYIHNISPIGVFVKFLNNLVGFAPKSLIFDYYVNNISDIYVEGQTVIALISALDKQKNRLILNLNPSKCKSAETTFYEIFCDEYYIQFNSLFKQEISLRIGDIISASIHQIDDEKGFKLISDISSQSMKIPIFIPNEHINKDQKYTVGMKVKCRVLDYDPLLHKYEGSLLPDLLISSNSDVNTGSFMVGIQVQICIQFIQNGHFVVSLPDYDHFLAFAISSSPNMPIHNNPHITLFSRFTAILHLLPKKNPRLSSCEDQIFFILLHTSKPSLSDIRKEKLLLKKQRKEDRRKNLLEGKLEENDHKRVKTLTFHDSKITSLDEIHSGMEISGFITKVTATKIFVAITPKSSSINVLPTIHISETNALFQDSFKLTDEYSVGNQVTARVCKMEEIEYQGKNTNFVHLSLLNNSQFPPTFSLKDVKLGQIFTCFLVKIDENSSMWVSISPSISGKIDLLEISDDIPLLKQKISYQVGDRMTSVCVSVDQKYQYVGLSLRFNNLPKVQEYISNLTDEVLPELSYLPLKSFQALLNPGDITIGKLVKKKQNGILFALRNSLYGFVHITDVNDVWSSDPLSCFSIGDILKVFVLSKNSDEGSGSHGYELSLRMSRLEPELIKNTPKFPEITSIEKLKAGQKVKGYVKQINSNGCFVWLNRHLVGRIMLHDLADTFVKDYTTRFPIGKLVTGIITEVDETKNKISLSLRRSIQVIPGKSVNFSELKLNSVVTGTVKSIESYGIFIKLDNCNVTGICHISQVSEKRITNLKNLYQPGDPVTALIIEKDEEKQRIQLSIKQVQPQTENLDNKEPENVIDVIEPEFKQNDVKIRIEKRNNPLDTTIENLISNAPSLDIDPSTISSKEINLKSKIEDEKVDDGVSKKKSRRAKLAARKKEEKTIQEKEDALADPDRVPQSIEEFESCVIAAPNSSYIWLQYIAFLISSKNISKARETIERALSTINFREDKEKFNIWSAYLTLENLYGTDDTLRSVFSRALQYNDPEKTYLQMAKIYDESDKNEIAQECYKVMLKKFKQNETVLLKYAQFLYTKKNLSDARQLLQSATRSFSKKSHVMIVSKFACFEFRYGDPGKGRTLFEGLMSNYPKKTDLWSMYIDQEIRLGEAEQIRKLFDRVINLNLSSKSMKFFFLKYLNYEKDHGDETSIEKVKQKAKDYVDSQKDNEDTDE